ncbi:MAG: hypothetical protein KBT03_02840 [Bacteroidales bacterium]|nr:hypothetical protein [Candidatus Scybalousia scybalohippi]
MKVFDKNYKFKIVKKPTEIMKILDCVGYCDFDKKEIYVLDNKDKEDTIVHEITHACLHTLAREDLAQDEDMVNLITRIVLEIKRILK